MNIFISQPMNGKTDEEIKETRKKIIKFLNEKFGEDVIDILDSDFKGRFSEDELADKNEPLFYLSKAIELMSEAEMVFFASGWGYARGCCIEHECALQYGIKIFPSTTEEYNEVESYGI